MFQKGREYLCQHSESVAEEGLCLMGLDSYFYKK
jgi:hypothetical protein